MFSLQNGNIIPEVGIGNIRLGMNKSDIEKILTEKSIHCLHEFYVYESEGIKVWINKAKDCVTQIMVFGNFNGKLMNKFGIGSHLSDIERQMGEDAEEEQYVYVFKNLKGICFELEEIEEEWDDIKWFKSNSKITSISIFTENS